MFGSHSTARNRFRRAGREGGLKSFTLPCDAVARGRCGLRCPGRRTKLSGIAPGGGPLPIDHAATPRDVLRGLGLALCCPVLAAAAMTGRRPGGCPCARAGRSRGNGAAWVAGAQKLGYCRDDMQRRDGLVATETWRAQASERSAVTAWHQDRFPVPAKPAATALHHHHRARSRAAP